MSQLLQWRDELHGHRHGGNFESGGSRTGDCRIKEIAALEGNSTVGSAWIFPLHRRIGNEFGVLRFDQQHSGF